ncbi:MAG: acyl-homoserine-lactone synthase [Pseudomonadota bacterium]
MNFTLVYGDDLRDTPVLADQMLRDRGALFKTELGWDLRTDEEGRETDAYDRMNPLYLILSDDEGRHRASTRLMPTTGPNMLADHFAHMTDGVDVRSPLVWEVTRFFVADKGARRAAPALMWAGCALALEAGVSFYAGVTGAHMTRVFAACGWAPEIIGRSESPEGEICACLWEVTPELRDRLGARAGIADATTPPRIHSSAAARARRWAVDPAEEPLRRAA